jgi:hypothetical protein
VALGAKLLVSFGVTLALARLAVLHAGDRGGWAAARRAAPVRATGAEHLVETEGSLEAAEPEVKIEVASSPVSISWTTHPDKCLDVSGGRAKNGNVLGLWSCDTSRNKQFLVPAAGSTGRIRWALHPEMCLDAPGGCELMWWNCSKGKYKNMLFMMPEGNQGAIRVSGRPHHCIDVPGGNSENGQRLQVWNCSSPHQNHIQFKIQPMAQFADIDCVWGVWSSWAACSKSCGQGVRSRGRVVVREQMGSGKACEGSVIEVESCQEVRRACLGTDDPFGGLPALRSTQSLPSGPPASKDRGRSGTDGLAATARAVLVVCFVRWWQWPTL